MSSSSTVHSPLFLHLLLLLHMSLQFMAYKRFALPVPVSLSTHSDLITVDAAFKRFQFNTLTQGSTSVKTKSNPFMHKVIMGNENLNKD